MQIIERAQRKSALDHTRRTVRSDDPPEAKVSALNVVSTMQLAGSAEVNTVSAVFEVR